MERNLQNSHMRITVTPDYSLGQEVYKPTLSSGQRRPMTSLLGPSSHSLRFLSLLISLHGVFPSKPSECRGSCTSVCRVKRRELQGPTSTRPTFKMKLLKVYATLLEVAIVAALNNGLSRTPAMGFNGYNAFV